MDWTDPLSLVRRGIGRRPAGLRRGPGRHPSGDVVPWRGAAGGTVDLLVEARPDLQ